MLTLRPYQEAVKAAVYDHLRLRDDNPCAVVPTAGGKTPIMASICKDAVGEWNGRVLILAHVKELLEQSADKLRTICPEIAFGVYSAGLKRRDTGSPVIVAGIQSVYRRACELDAFDLVMVDEAHLIPAEGEGMYRQFLADAKVIDPALRIVGFTATPFRLKTGPICTPDGILNHVCIEIGVRELIRDGFLSPLLTKAGINKADFGQLHIRGGEFVADEVENLMDDERLNHWQSEFVCFEHDGYARQKAIAWWRQRSPDPVPDTAERGVEIAAGGGVASTQHITVRSIAGEKYDRIVSYKLGPKPNPVPAGDGYCGYDPDEIPF